MRTNLILAGIAGVLAIPTAITIVNERSSFTDYSDVPRLFEGFTPENIAVVQLSKSELDENGEVVKNDKDQPKKQALQMRKTVDGWAVGQPQGIVAKSVGAPVQTKLVVQNVLEHIEAVRRDDEALVARDANEDTLKEYELDDDRGLLIQCLDKNNKIVAELLRGRTARDASAGKDALRGFFVRRKDSRDIVLYEQDAWYADLDPARWIDRQLFDRSAASEAVRFKIVTPEGVAEFVKDDKTDTTWAATEQPPGTGGVRQGEVDQRLNQVLGAQVSDYIQPLPQAEARRNAALKMVGLVAPELRAEITLEGGQELSISIGSKVTDKNEHHAIVGGGKFVITVADWVKSTIERDPAQLLDPADSAARKDDPEAGEPDKKDDGKD